MSFNRGIQTPDARARAAQTRFIEDSVKKVQLHFGTLCNDFGGICRKTGKLRDRYDGLAKTCLKFADVEMGTLKRSLTDFAENISAVQDYRQAQIERVEKSVVEPLKRYGMECKHTEADLNRHISARKREEKQHQQINNLRNKSSGDLHTLNQAELELQKRSIDVARSTQSMEETIDKFENRKVQDIKVFLREFVKIEMIFHAKSLEILSNAYKTLGNIDEDEHMQNFRNALRPSNSIHERLEIAKSALTSSSRSRLEDQRLHDSRRRTSSANNSIKGDSKQKRKTQKKLSFEDEISENGRSYEDSDEEDDSEDYTESSESEKDVVTSIKPRKPW